MRRLFPLYFLLPILLLPSMTLSRESSLTTGFHHVHLNSLDPSKAIDFYTNTFDVTKKIRLAGFDAVQSEKIYLLFNKVKKPPAISPDSAIWHFGWGSTAMETDYQKHIDKGVIFHTPMIRLGSGMIEGPDAIALEIIEIK